LRRVFAFGLDEWRKNCLSAYLFICTHPHCKIVC
jgi:hypothetical protein